MIIVELIKQEVSYMEKGKESKDSNLDFDVFREIGLTDDQIQTLVLVMIACGLFYGFYSIFHE